jgi:hypothetical protein
VTVLDVGRPENMRVNLHARASSMGWKVRTRKLKDDDQGEGLAFQFFGIEPSEEMSERSDGPDALIELLYQDAVEIYERARREVTICHRPHRSGGYGEGEILTVSLTVRPLGSRSRVVKSGFLMKIGANGAVSSSRAADIKGHGNEAVAIFVVSTGITG